MVNKKFWATVFTLSGTVIGAGILGLPYVFAKSGFFMGLFWLLFLGIVMLLVNFYLGEVSLRTKGKHHLIGYAEKYLGKRGKKLLIVGLMFEIYFALLAYLVGEGQSFSQLFTGGLEYTLIFGLGFWLVMSLLLREGLKELKKVEWWGVLGIIIVIILIVFQNFQDIDYSNFLGFNSSNIFLPLGVVLFALMGFTSIPELRMEIKGDEKKLKKALFLGTVIPIILYILFSFVFVGVLGKEILEVASLNFGKLVTVLGIFTMMTSYFVLSFCLKDSLNYDLKVSKFWSFILTAVSPLIVYLILNYLGWVSFVDILGIGGVVAGALIGISILFMNKNAKEKGDRKPEYSMPINWWIIGILSFIFIAGVILELVKVF